MFFLNQRAAGNCFAHLCSLTRFLSFGIFILKLVFAEGTYVGRFVAKFSLQKHRNNVTWATKSYLAFAEFQAAWIQLASPCSEFGGKLGGTTWSLRLVGGALLRVWPENRNKKVYQETKATEMLTNRDICNECFVKYIKPRNFLNYWLLAIFVAQGFSKTTRKNYPNTFNSFRKTVFQSKLKKMSFQLEQ